MNREQAEILALQALAWLAGHEDLAGVFLGSTGASSDDLRQRSGDPEFLASVLDFLMMDDAWVVAFCDELSMTYNSPMRARQMLPGGQDQSWT